MNILILGLVLKNFALPGCFALYYFLLQSFLLTFFWLICYCGMWLYYTPCTTKLLGGYIGFTPSVRPSVCPSVRPASRVRSVAPTVLVGSISCLYILSGNFRRCVACRAPTVLVHNEVVGGYIGFTPSVRPSVRLSGRLAIQILETIKHPAKKDGKLNPVTSRHRRKREDFWMETLHTVYPYGLNNRHGRNKDQEDEEKAVKTSLKPRCKKKERKHCFRRTSDIKDGGLIYKDITSMFGKEEDSNNVEYLNQAIKGSHKIILQLREWEVKKIGELALEDSYNDSHVPIRLLHMIIDLTRAKLQTRNTESNKEKKKGNTKLAFIVRYQNHGIQMLNLGSMIHKADFRIFVSPCNDSTVTIAQLI